MSTSSVCCVLFVPFVPLIPSVPLGVWVGSVHFFNILSINVKVNGKKLVSLFLLEVLILLMEQMEHMEQVEHVCIIALQPQKFAVLHLFCFVRLVR